MEWFPAAVLPNIQLSASIEGEGIALAPPYDPRVQAAHANFRKFLDRFTDAFRRTLEPVSLIVNQDLISKSTDMAVLAAFRDLLALSVIPYARALNQNHRQWPRICYSDSFWLYPWMLNKENEYLVANTPAIRGLEAVEEFHGQSSPALPVLSVDELDRPLFEVLVRRWKRHYLGMRPRWEDRALFRSLNMAQHAAQLPAGSDTTLYDIGRLFGLWVSACEILSHPGRTGKSDILKVYGLLEQTSYSNPNAAARRFKAYGSKNARRCLPCWAYGRMHQFRNDFMHGNPIDNRRLTPRMDRPSLFWIAPCLYRLALTGFLKLNPASKEPMNFAEFVKTRCQSEIEQAVLKYR
jgi:hypothetical protein